MSKSDNEIISDAEKVKLTEESLKSFSEQFGEDDHIKLVFLDVLFEEAFKKNNFVLY